MEMNYSRKLIFISQFYQMFGLESQLRHGVLIFRKYTCRNYFLKMRLYRVSKGQIK